MAAGNANKQPPHPTYPEMIMGAIEALKEKNGCNKTAISKYMESHYGNLPAGHATLLSHHLNKMKDTGELVFWKNNYTKADPNAPPRRGRGRPPKDKTARPVVSIPRPRGRPPKGRSSTLKASKSAAAGSGRPRGRPRKITQASGAPKMATGSGRPRGRPRKIKADEESGQN